MTLISTIKKLNKELISRIKEKTVSLRKRKAFWSPEHSEFRLGTVEITITIIIKNSNMYLRYPNDCNLTLA